MARRVPQVSKTPSEKVGQIYNVMKNDSFQIINKSYFCQPLIPFCYPVQESCPYPCMCQVRPSCHGRFFRQSLAKSDDVGQLHSELE